MSGRFPYYVVVGILAGVIFWRGVLPALSGPETDFPNYYTASRLLLEGADASRLYDNIWFQEQMVRLGFEQKGKFSPFPPPTAVVFLPIAWLEPSVAFAVLTVANLLALVACIQLMSLITGIRREKAAGLTLAAGLAIINCLRFGQLYIIVILSLLLSYHLARQGKGMLAGVSAGLLLPVKLFPLVLVLWFLGRKQWKSAGAAVMTSAGIVGLSMILMGPGVFAAYVSTILPDHLASRYDMQNPYATAFQSWDSLLMRLFVKDPLLNPNAFWDSWALYMILKIALTFAGGAITLWASVRLLMNGQQTAVDLMLALVGVAALLFAPGTATYHFVLLWLPIALIVLQPPDGTWLSRILIFVYIAIGWIPYGWFRRFEDSPGIGVVLAYPRLALLTLLFCGLTLLVARASSHLPPTSGATVDLPA